jgi:UDP-2,3-diacylglucosamine pyrophosphatase LpxH
VEFAIVPTMSDAFSNYDVLYVVSDLHLGGFDGTDSKGRPRSYRIFRDAEALAWAIERFAAESSKAKLGLVLNGDVVDFLADADPVYFDAEGADQKLRAMIEDREQNGVWKALQSYVRAGQGDLVITLGNHDVELGLPTVRARLRDFLAGEDRAARGRLHFALDGAGFRCSVGTRSVLCVHGNEADGWNAVDHPRLVQIARALNRGEPAPAWDANAGTTLVIDIMNGIKRDHQWVDLLKPEKNDVALVLAGLRPELLGQLQRLAPVAYRGAWDAVKRSLGLMGGEARATAPSAPSPEERKFVDELHAVAGAPEPRADDWIAEAKSDAEANIDPLSLVAGSGAQTLGLRDDVEHAGLVYGVRGDPAKVRDALLQLAGKDESFDPNVPDETFLKLDPMISPMIDFLVAGHTHHCKAHGRLQGRGVYLNSGTWIQLVRLSKDALSAKRWPQVWETLKQGDLPSIEKSQADLLVRPRNVVKIAASGKGAHGSLHTVSGSTRADFALEPVPASRTVVV